MLDRSSSFPCWIACSLLLLMNVPAVAASLSVRVAGLAAPFGEVGCTLFDNAAGFPMDAAAARSQWQPASGPAIECRFDDLPTGTYAVSIGHDRNGNREVDTNFLGIPTEQWGVSNNARPLMRAPKFTEAQFSIDAGAAPMVIDISVDP